MTDKEIDDFLNELNTKPEYTLIFEVKKDITDKTELLKEFNSRRKIIYIAEELELIKQIFDHPDSEIKLFTFTEKGRNVTKRGGWIKYCERQNEIEDKRILKENYDLKISEFQAKNPRLPYFISVCGLIISIIAIFISCNNASKEHNQRQSSSLAQEQSKLEDTTLTKTEMKYTNYTDSLSIE